MGTPDPNKPCEARHYRRKGNVCGKPSDTTRKVQAAPGLWIHVRLCHQHQHVWDEAQEWGGAEPIGEKPCGPRSHCRTPFPYPLGKGIIEDHLRWLSYETGNTLIREDRRPHWERARDFLRNKFSNIEEHVFRLAFVMGWDACEREKDES